MKSFVDKAVIVLFSILLILNTYSPGQRIFMVFLMVIVGSFSSYFRMLGEKWITANKILMVLLSASVVIWPELIIMAPMLAYEIYLDRHYTAGLVLVMGVVRFCTGEGISTEIAYDMAGEPGTYLSKIYCLLYIVLETGLSIYLAYRTDCLLRYEKENRKIRDEGEIKKETLKKQNRNLMDEQDKSISAAQLAERNRIAREIHDNVGHMLSRSILQVGAMMVVHKDEKIAEELKSLRETLDTAMNNIRSSVHDIRDEAIKLDSALEEILEPLKGSFKVSFEFDADTDSVAKEVKYAAINIVKEAVSNIIKYSENDCVDVRFYEHPSMYQIIVHDYCQNGGTSEHHRPDNGKIKNGSSQGEGMGLENIRTRAEKLGGNATITNENGFRVFVRIPKDQGARE